MLKQRIPLNDGYIIVTFLCINFSGSCQRYDVASAHEFVINKCREIILLFQINKFYV